MLYSALICVLQELLQKLRIFYGRARKDVYGGEGRDYDSSHGGCGDEEKSPGLTTRRRDEGNDSGTCTRNKDGTISRMRSTFSTNAGSQAVKQIRPSYIYGVSR